MIGGKRMFKHIRTQFLSIIIPVVILSMMVTYLFSIYIGKNIIETGTKGRINAEQSAQTKRIEDELKMARAITEETAAMASQTYKYGDLKMYENTLQSIVASQSMMIGSGIWFEPYLFDSDKKYTGPYVYKEARNLIITYEYENVDYDYPSQAFYLLPKEQEKTIFTDVYYDKALDSYLVTCASPIFDENHNYIGCTTIDIELNFIKNIIEEYGKLHDGDSYILNKDGLYLAHSSEDFSKDEKNINFIDNISLQEAAKTILAHKTGVTSYQKNGETIYLYYDTMKTWEWKIVYELPEKIMKAPLYRFNRVFFMICFISAAIIGLLIYLIISKSISKPLQILEKDIIQLGNQHNYNTETSNIMRRKDEVGRIGNAFSEMKKKLYQFEQALYESMEEVIASNEEISQQNELLIKQEKLLIEKTKYNSAIIEAMPDMLFVFSKNGQFLECQGNTSSMYMPKEKFIGKYLSELFSEDLVTVAMQKINDAITTREMQVFEYELANGTESGYFELRIVECYDEKVIGIVRDITNEHKRVDEIQYISFHDQLTGLFNRRYYEFVLQEISNNQWDLPISVVYSDVNGLKLVNDSFGHSVGDLLLKKYAQILHQSKKKDEVIARIGGDEFAILIPGKSEDEVCEYVNVLNQACKMEQINGLSLSVAFGYGTITKEDQSIQNVINSAEDMMYKNKMFEADSRHSRMINIIIQTLQEKNPREEQHSHRVAELCEKLAIILKKDEIEVQKIKNAALLHDIGKIGISEEILNKEGALSKEEYQTICKHSEIGHRILRASSYLAEVSEIVLYHHERWDGQGYPYGLEGDNIPVEARMITIADSYDAMISERTYKKARSLEEAREEIARNAGTQFDPYLVQIFLNKVINK